MTIGILKLLFLVISVIYGCVVYAEIQGFTEDAIIIEAGESRQNRNFPFARQTWAEALGEGSPCLASTGILGSCTSFRSCYPYVKIPNVSVWESWLLGNYDTCSYFTTEGRQTFGVCCTNPIVPLPGSDANASEANTEKNHQITDSKYQNWPPAVPTHPTATTAKPSSTSFQWPPPIPTHPPDHHYPTHPTGTTSSTQKPSTTTKKPLQSPTTTTKPWQPPSTTKPSTSYPWPPTAPTHPTISTTQWPSYNFTTSSASPIQDDGFSAMCGAKNGILDQERIVGGQNSSPNEWPWVVVLFNNGRQFCGGSLIDNKHILTAAHCVAQYVFVGTILENDTNQFVWMSSWDVARLKVHLGDHNIKQSNEVKHIERKIKRVVRHRGFDFRTLYHDVAVLTMDQPVTYSKTVRPVCLPTVHNKAYNGKVGTVAGWGSIRENGPQPAILQKVSIPVWSNRECARKYGGAAPGGIIDSMLCAGQAGKDSCSGDSGGPLMVNEGSWTQVGIVSWGIGCGKGQYPGVYTRVSSYIDWIKKNRNL